MKLGTVIPCLKKIQKYMNHVTYPLSSTDISIFSLEIRKFCSIKKCRYKLHFVTQFLILLSLRSVLTNMAAILMISAKMATLGLLQTKLFEIKALWRPNFSPWHHNKILSCDSNYIADMIMWLNFSNSSISIREVIYKRTLYGLTRKTTFFEGWS